MGWVRDQYFQYFQGGFMGTSGSSSSMAWLTHIRCSRWASLAASCVAAVGGWSHVPDLPVPRMLPCWGAGLTALHPEKKVGLQCCLCVQTCAGLGYSFSLYAPALKDRFGFR